MTLSCYEANPKGKK